MLRAERSWRTVRLWCATTAGIALLGLGGCQTQDDAAAASQQMAQTASIMQQYFATLDTLIVDTEDVQRAQNSLLGVPLDAASLGLLEDTRVEIGKRAKLAQDLTKLASSFAEITDSHAAKDAGTAAAALNKELVAVKITPANDAAATALRAAVNSLVNAIRARDEVKAAKILNPIMQAFCDFYDSEKPMYISAANSYYVTAASNAGVLIDQDQVALEARYRLSLQPFGMEPDIRSAALRKASHDDMKHEVEQKLAQHQQENAQSADALGDALHRMQARIEVVAQGKTLHVRIPPLSLEGVKAWIATIQKDTGVGL